MHMIRTTVIGLLFFPFSSAFSQQIIVGWGGDSVSQTQDLNGFNSQSQLTGVQINDASRAGRLVIPPGTDSIADGIVGIPFSVTTQLSPTSGYIGQRFFGGMSVGLLGGTGTLPPITRAAISNSGNDDVLDFRYQLNNTAHDAHVSIFFDKSDFLVGSSPTEKVQLGANSTLNIRFNANTSNQVNNDGEMRWIVREGGQWWVSAQNAAGQPNIRSQDDGQTGIQNNRSFTSSFASGELSYWAPYDPTSGSGLLGLNFEPAYDSRFVITAGSNPFILKSFTDISAIGFYVEGDQFSTNIFQFEVAEMNFSVMVVPEPVTVVLMGVLGLGAFALRTLRQKTPAKVIPTTLTEEPDPTLNLSN